jgi:predicted nucleic acid-binding Zn ribbon protein
MPTYVYRTYPPVGSGIEPQEFEVEQSIHDNSLLTDPRTGLPVKRVIKGGYVYVAKTKSSSSPSPSPSPSSSPSCCGGGCGCH